MSTSYGEGSPGERTTRGDDRTPSMKERLLGGRGDRGDQAGSDVGPGTAGAGATPAYGSTAPLDRREVVAREKEEFGGVKIGSAFFGWLTATGVAVLLTTLLAAGGTAIGLSAGTDLGDAAQQATEEATENPEAIGIAGGIGLLVILFLAYFCGGYVAGRMARFNGARQGVAVWLWGILIAVVVAILGAVAGNEYDVLARLNLPRIPVNEGDATTGGIIALVAVVLASLVGAILGGLAGMRFHRKVDRAGLGR